MATGTPDTNLGQNALGVNTSGYPQGNPTGAQESGNSPAQGNQFDPQPVVLGLGVTTAAPAGTTNGTPLATPPVGATRVRFTLPPGATLSMSLQRVQPVAAPPIATYAAPAAATGAATLTIEEYIAQGVLPYVTAMTGGVVYRYV